MCARSARLQLCWQLGIAAALRPFSLHLNYSGDTILKPHGTTKAATLSPSRAHREFAISRICINVLKQFKKQVEEEQTSQRGGCARQACDSEVRF